MNDVQPPTHAALLRGDWRKWERRGCIAGAVLVVMFVVHSFFQFRMPDQGFTYLLDFGATLGRPHLPEINFDRVYLHPGVAGYDATYYAQLAFRPSADTPDLLGVIDNPPYRARRMMMPWLAHLLGFGRPEWVLNVYCFLNLAGWVGLAWVSMRWMRPVDLHGFVRWAGLMLSAGVLGSMRHALTDEPALLFLALAVACVESGRVWIGALLGTVSGLTRETGVLVCAAFAPADPRSRPGWIRSVALSVVSVLPVAIWMLHMNQVWSGKVDDAQGWQAIAAPFVGFVHRWRQLGSLFETKGWGEVRGNALFFQTALTVQALWMLLRPQWSKAWWRIGIAHVCLMAIASDPVWDGYPGAAARAFLPLLMAFNILVPRSRSGLLVLLIGNLTVFAGFQEIAGPPGPVWELRGDRAIIAPFDEAKSDPVEFISGFYRADGHGSNAWRWTSGDAVVRLLNPGAKSFHARIRLGIRAAEPRLATVRAGEQTLWHGPVDHDRRSVDCGGVVVPPGGLDLTITSDQPPKFDDGAQRTQSLRIYDFEVTVEPMR